MCQDAGLNGCCEPNMGSDEGAQRLGGSGPQLQQLSRSAVPHPQYSDPNFSRWRALHMDNQPGLARGGILVDVRTRVQGSSIHGINKLTGIQFDFSCEKMVGERTEWGCQIGGQGEMGGMEGDHQFSVHQWKWPGGQNKEGDPLSCSIWRSGRQRGP